MNLLNIATTLCIGLLIGTEFAMSVFVNPVLWKLDEVAQLAAIRLFARRVGTAMPFWYIASLLLLVSATLGHLHQPGVMLLGAATGVWAAVIVLTLLFLVPIATAWHEWMPIHSRKQRGENTGNGIHSTGCVLPLSPFPW